MLINLSIIQKKRNKNIFKFYLTEIKKRSLTKSKDVLKVLGQMITTKFSNNYAKKIYVYAKLC